ncbi:hypothetical protein [Georgenia sunbinii]|uniref:hypothetical protein n=1 Tax=Georgenia sunbinii TaxID=3117728 RepID=UPI002F266CD2
MRSSRVPISATALVASFFASGAVVSHPTIRPRITRVRQHLDTYLDTEAEQLLGYDDLILLDVQRQLDPVHAVLQVGGVPLLIHALPGFCQPAWLLPDPADARAQLLTVLALHDWIVGEVPAAASHESSDRVRLAARAAFALLDGTPHGHGTARGHELS